MRKTSRASALLFVLFVTVAAWAMHPADVATDATAESVDRSRPAKPAPSRRLLGAWLLASTGAVVILRGRRSRTR